MGGYQGDNGLGLRVGEGRLKVGSMHRMCGCMCGTCGMGACGMGTCGMGAGGMGTCGMGTCTCGMGTCGMVHIVWYICVKIF